MTTATSARCARAAVGTLMVLLALVNPNDAGHTETLSAVERPQALWNSPSGAFVAARNVGDEESADGSDSATPAGYPPTAAEHISTAATTVELGRGSDGAQFTFEVTPSSAVDPLTSKTFDVFSVENPPEAADWLLLEVVSGPRFSGLPAWFPYDRETPSAMVTYWSEYFDRNDLARDPVDPSHPVPAKDMPRGSFTVALSAWTGRNGTKLATAVRTPAIHFDKTYTAMLWNISAAERGTPGAIALALTPANAASESLAPATRYAWWFRYTYTGLAKDGTAQFAESPTIEKSLEPPTFELGVSVPGVYYIGIFGSFSTGVSKGQPDGADGFVSQRAPLVEVPGGAAVFQPVALVIPFANGTVPAVAPGFKGAAVLLSAIPGDARFAMQPFEGQSYTKVTMFDGGAIALRLFYPDSKLDIAFMEAELPPCIVLQNTSRNYKYTVVSAPSQPDPGSGTHRVRLLPTPAGRWSSAQRVLWLLPRISCAAHGTKTIRVRPLLTEAFARETGNWQEIRANIVPIPTALAKSPKRLAPSLTWAPVYHFAPNETAAGIAHSIQMFRNVGMTTIPQSGCRNLDPSKASSAAKLFTPDQREAELWRGLQYGPQISSFCKCYRCCYVSRL